MVRQEFRNTQFSYAMGLDGLEEFVATPELQSEGSIGSDPLPAGQVWAIGPGGQDEATGLYRIEVNEGPGSGVRILNQSPPAPFRESVRIAEQNLYARAQELVGDRNPREHEFAVQLRSFDAVKSGTDLGVGLLVALASALLCRPLKGGLTIVGGITLGGSIEPVHNPIDVVELALEKGASLVIMPVSCRRPLVDLSDDVATERARPVTAEGSSMSPLPRVPAGRFRRSGTRDCAEATERLFCGLWSRGNPGRRSDARRGASGGPDAALWIIRIDATF